jgi:hypothetical protein
LNTCDGEGFGLCNFEHAVFGKPQVIPNVGGFKSFNGSESIKIEPEYTQMLDNSRDSMGGMAEIVTADDVADGLIKILEKSVTENETINYKTWTEVGETFVNILRLIN